MFCLSGDIPPLLASSAACQQIICLPAETASHGKKFEEQNWLLARFLQADLAMRNNCCWQKECSALQAIYPPSCKQRCLPANNLLVSKRLEEQNWLLASFLQADLSMRNNFCQQERKLLASCNFLCQNQEVMILLLLASRFFILLLCRMYLIKVSVQASSDNYNH